MALVTVTLAICILGVAVSRALMELSLSLKPAELEVQNIEYIEEELMENYRAENRFATYQNDHGSSVAGPNKYSMQTLKNVED